MKKQRRNAIIISIVISVILFGAGLFSGLSVSKLIEQRQKEDFSFLVEYVNTLDTNLKSFQIQERFIDSLPSLEACSLKDAYFAQIADSLKYYWSILPERLESYEREHEPSDAYLELKQQYTSLNLRAWMIARENHRECSRDTIPALYFYSVNCTDCVQQGENLDNARELLKEDNMTLVVFTFDEQSPDSALQLIKKYYDIDKTPALVINEQTYQGEILSASQIMGAAR
jgi:hypothetical protein